MHTHYTLFEIFEQKQPTYKCGSQILFATVELVPTTFFATVELVPGIL